MQKVKLWFRHPGWLEDTKRCMKINLRPHRPQVAAVIVHIDTSKKAFICFCTRLTNLHWITRLSQRRKNKTETLILDSGLMLRFYKKSEDHVLTLCIPFCSHWWPPCLSRWASGPPGRSKYEIKIRQIKTTLVIKTQGSIIKMGLLSGWLQRHHLPKVVLVNTKPQVQLGGVVLQNPLEGVVIFTVLQGDNARQVKTWGARGEKKKCTVFLHYSGFKIFDDLMNSNLTTDSMSFREICFPSIIL